MTVSSFETAPDDAAMPPSPSFGIDVNAIASSLTDSINDALSHLPSGGTGLPTDLTSSLNDLAGTIIDAIDEIAGNLPDDFDTSTIEDVITGIFDTASDALDGVDFSNMPADFGDLGDLADSTPDGVDFAALNTFFDSLASGGDVAALQDFVDSLPSDSGFYGLNDFVDTLLQGSDFNNIDFSGLDFSNIDFSNIDFSSLDFSSLDFSSLDFSGIDLGDLANAMPDGTDPSSIADMIDTLAEAFTDAMASHSAG
jgi:hypothetical protein